MVLPCSQRWRWLLPALLVFLILAGPARALAAGSCSPLPPINTSRGFVANFNNPCYALPLTGASGPPQTGDYNATYDEVYYQVVPGYELIVLGTFPNARFLSATVYDDHLAVATSMIDANILPMSSSMVNPLLPGASFTPGQLYGLTVTLGGGSPITVSPGCSTAGTTIDQNELDASQLHQGLTWTGYPGLPAGFPAHETGPNAGGIVMIRKYVDIDSPPVPEVAIVRSLANGCAIPVQTAIQLNIMSVSQPLTSNWLHQTQINAHQQFAQQIRPSWCFPQDPQNMVRWMRSADYVPVNDNYAGYINAPLSAPELQSVLSGQTYLRIQFVLPTTPNTPCTNGQCALTGLEQTRYFSISFEGPAKNVAGPVTIFSLSDTNLVHDPNGNVTIVAGFGGPQPPNVTAANYYTWVDLSTAPNYTSIIGLRVRNLLSSPAFECSTFNVPFETTEYHPEGGFMGPYVPSVEFRAANQFPVVPPPMSRPSSCFTVPPQLPVACAYSNAGKSPIF